MYIYVILFDRKACFMKRREAREALFVLLYEMSFNSPEELEETILKAKENRDIDDAYILQSIHGIYEHLSEIDQKISAHARGWSLERLSRTTLAIMRISVYEMQYAEIPYTISINEAVEIAKKYDHDQAPTFINGILNAIATASGLKNKA